MDYFVSGVGTGGTITGVVEVLKRKCPQIKVIAVEASVLSGKQVKPHIIQGIGFGFVPSV
ncbi:pyridoxal-phosphate dependent enzyme, partial [Candidatus Hodgkinia cicadicola]